MSLDTKVDSNLIILAGYFTLWFTNIDICDGMRARRLKVGSPLGRFVDEAGDCMVMTSYGTILAYVFNFNNILFDYMSFYVIIGFFGMELKH